MLPRRCVIAVVVALGVGWLGPARVGAEAPRRVLADDGILLLHNGGVLRGRIEATDSRYVVKRDHSQVDVAASQVAMVCESLAAAYEQQRGQMPRATAEAHLELADWCLRHDLIEQAMRELADARRLDPRHPRLRLVERRVAVLTAPRGATPPASPAPAEAAEASSASPADELPPVSIGDDLPEGVVERFTRRIQPLLVNNCTTAACHQRGGNQEFQLDRAVLRGMSNRRTTSANLAATLSLVDRAAPMESPLLTIPREPHGGRKGPMFGIRHEEHLQALAEWVALVTGTGSDNAGPNLAQGGASPTGPERPPLAAKSNPNTMPTPAAMMLANHEEEFSLRPPPRPPQVGAALDAWRPDDEFDPEIFNRRFRQPSSTPGDRAMEMN